MNYFGHLLQTQFSMVVVMAKLKMASKKVGENNEAQ